jgi:hypothetical protein
MFTVYFRGQLYCRDETRDYIRNNKETDSWDNLNSYPADGTTGFDCEDGAQWVIEMLYLLKHGDFTDVNLKLMQRFYADNYIAFFTLGELQSIIKDEQGRPSEGLVAHAYVCLLDKNFVLGVKTSYNPAIIIESTTFLQGCQDPCKLIQSSKDFDDAVDWHFEKQQYFTFPGIKDKESKWRRVCKIRITPPVMTEKKMYGDVWNLACPDMPDGSAVYYALRTTGKFGVNYASLYSYDQSVQLCVVLSVPKEEQYKLNEINRETPLSRIPMTPKEKTYPMILKGQCRFTFRSCDFEQNRDMFINAFKSQLKDTQKSIDPIKVMITDKVAMYIIDL